MTIPSSLFAARHGACFEFAFVPNPFCFAPSSLNGILQGILPILRVVQQSTADTMQLVSVLQGALFRVRTVTVAHFLVSFLSGLALYRRTGDAFYSIGPIFAPIIAKKSRLRQHVIRNRALRLTHPWHTCRYSFTTERLITQMRPVLDRTGSGRGHLRISRHLFGMFSVSYAQRGTCRRKSKQTEFDNFCSKLDYCYTQSAKQTHA